MYNESQRQCACSVSENQTQGWWSPLVIGSHSVTSHHREEGGCVWGWVGWGGGREWVEVSPLLHSRSKINTQLLAQPVRLKSVQSLVGETGGTPCVSPNSCGE